MEKDNRKCIHMEIEGIVQGVGFRPFLHRLAEKYSIDGWVRNTSSGLEGRLKGTPADLENFLTEIQEAPPPMAVIERITAVEDHEMQKHEDPAGFHIENSQTGGGATMVSPDIAICPECRKELEDPWNRRYRYPFINCTSCGPRYTIIRSLPYDRKRTVMERFTMCDACEKEYHEIHDRRYHAQPNCCADCGPQVFFQKPEDGVHGTVLYGEDAFRESQKLLARGGILAVKGIGGIHLACDGRNESAVKRLREKKNRKEKPLALMARSMKTVREICRVSKEEERLLMGPEHPIVLLSKKSRNLLPELSFSARLGMMLPYTPLHILLADGAYGGPDLLVMTSGNQKGCPVETENEQALENLGDIADGFLLHDRPIENRCDDSLVMEWKGGAYFLRRSRGYTPRPLKPDFGDKEEHGVDGIFALGAEQKASFAMGREDEVFLSPHIGDLKNAETYAHYMKTWKTYMDLFGLKPSLYVCDLHPDYLSSQEALRRSGKEGVPLLKVQHHWAHMASCMAENGLSGPCFGIIWDGTGLGTDQKIWGGECLIGDYEDFKRVGSIRPIPLLGGDKAVYEIGRIALALVEDAGVSEKACVPVSEEKYDMLKTLMTNPVVSPEAASIGRLFDGVCAVLTGRSEVDYEGEGAVIVESLSPVETPDQLEGSLEDLAWPVSFYEKNGIRFFDTRPLMQEIVRAVVRQEDPGQTAVRFMAALCRMALEQCLVLNREKLPVVLSGGVFQNRFLLAGITSLLEKYGFRVYTHRQVSANDEGLCLGQLAIARERRRKKHVFSNADEN